MELLGLFGALSTDLWHPNRSLEPLLHNDHIHIGPNFGSLWTPSTAIARAEGEGLGYLAASNYYDFRFYPEFAKECLEKGIFPGLGLEIITEVNASNPVRFNDPANPGRCYLCGIATAGIMSPSSDVQALLDQIRDNDSERIRGMIKAINSKMASLEIGVHLTEEGIINSLVPSYGCDPTAIVLQERHLAAALQEALFALDGPDNDSATRKAAGEVKDPKDPVEVQNSLRSRLMKAGKDCYVEEKFPDFKDSVRAIRKLEGIPCYPILADGTDNTTEYEQDPTMLAVDLIRHGIYMVQFITGRNKIATVERYMAAMDKVGILATVGTEHNTPSILPLTPACSDGPLTPDLLQKFWEGACVAAAHQLLVMRGEQGFIDSGGDRVDPHDLIQIGNSLIRQVNPNTVNRGVACSECYRFSGQEHQPWCSHRRRE